MRLASYLAAPLRVNSSCLLGEDYSSPSFQQSRKWESNPRPHPYHGCALPTELFRQDIHFYYAPQEYSYGVAEDTGLEPATVSPAAAFKAVCFPFAYPPWCPRSGTRSRKRELNPQPFPYKGSALPIELFRHTSLRCSFSNVTTYGVTLSNHCSTLLCASDGT